MLGSLRYKFKNFCEYLFKRHILNQASAKDHKKIFHYLKIIIQNKFFDYPRLAIIETGTTCNLNCATCPTPRSYLGRPMSLMAMDKFKKIIDNIKNFIHVVVLYNTNEPLLNPHLPEMAAYAGQSNLYTMLSTNATLLDERKTDEIIRSGLDEILLCLDGMTKEAYEPFRQGADFGTVIKNIRYFCEEKKRRKLKKPYVEIQFIATKLNQNQIEEAKRFVKEVGADRLRVKSLSVVEYAYSEQRRKELLEKFLPTRPDIKIRYERDESGGVHKRKVLNCNTVKNQISILVDGSLVLCCYDVKGEHIYGNLASASFKDLWLDPKNIIKRKQAEKREYPLCSRCDLY